MSNGCEFMKCSDLKNGICHYDSPYCKYREVYDINQGVCKDLKILRVDGHPDGGIPAVITIENKLTGEVVRFVPEPPQ